MARQADGSTDTLESDFERVCQPAAPQVTQLWYKKVGNTWELNFRIKSRNLRIENSWKTRGKNELKFIGSYNVLSDLMP